ncbi:hypothetical protein KCV03_g51, partial [Aureobasidium melanogenum]
MGLATLAEVQLLAFLMLKLKIIAEISACYSQSRLEHYTKQERSLDTRPMPIHQPTVPRRCEDAVAITALPSTWYGALRLRKGKMAE